MEFNYPITYLKCQSCDAKNHCRQCAAQAEAALLESGAATAIRLDFRLHTAALTAAGEAAALDALERAGVLV